MNPLQRILILFVRLYRVTLSPLIAFLAGPSGACRFEPSCSQYAIDALKTHGTIHGSWLATKRICRCHPGSPGGQDPVPTKLKDPTLDTVSSHQIPVGAIKFFPLPKGEGWGEGERIANIAQPQIVTAPFHHLNLSARRAPR
jgi:putative membrane protein insertion efficiency factor